MVPAGAGRRPRLGPPAARASRGRRRKGRHIDLPVRGERQRVELHEGGRNHVVGEPGRARDRAGLRGDRASCRRRGLFASDRAGEVSPGRAWIQARGRGAASERSTGALEQHVHAARARGPRPGDPDRAAEARAERPQRLRLDRGHRRVARPARRRRPPSRSRLAAITSAMHARVRDPQDLQRAGSLLAQALARRPRGLRGSPVQGSADGDRARAPRPREGSRHSGSASSRRRPNPA